MPQKGAVAIICCIDPEVQIVVFEHAKGKYGVGNFILLTARGAELPFTVNGNQQAYDHIVDELRFIQRELGLARIVIASHSICKAYEEVGIVHNDSLTEEDTHRGNASIAITRLREIFDNVPAEVWYCLKEDGCRIIG